MFEPMDAFLARVEREPEPSWLIPDLLPDRGKVFIVAEPSAGKTWFALLGCRAASTAGRDVFLIEEEGTGKSLGWRMKALNIDGSVHVAHARSVLIDDDPCRAELVTRVQNATKPVVVFDPFTSLHSGNENDTEHANTVRRYLTEVASANPDSLLIVCHHTSKNSERTPMYLGRGSSVFAGWTDVQLNLTHLVTRKEEGRVAFRVLLAKSRDGHRGLKRDVFIDLATGSVETCDPSDETEEIDGLIISALRNAPAGLIRSDLPKIVRRRKRAVLECTKALVDEGAIQKAKSSEGKDIVRLLPTASKEEEE